MTIKKIVERLFTEIFVYIEECNEDEIAVDNLVINEKKEAIKKSLSDFVEKEINEFVRCHREYHNDIGIIPLPEFPFLKSALLGTDEKDKEGRNE